jgi:hypothetical protein
MFEKTLEFKAIIMLCHDKQKNIKFVAMNFEGPSVGHCWSYHYMFEPSGVSTCMPINP